MRKEVFATGDAVIDVGEMQSKFYVVEKGHLMVEEGFSIHELMDKYTHTSTSNSSALKLSNNNIGQSGQQQQDIARSRVGLKKAHCCQYWIILLMTDDCLCYTWKMIAFH